MAFRKQVKDATGAADKGNTVMICRIVGCFAAKYQHG